MRSLPTLDSSTNVPAGCAALVESTLSRRGFVSTAAWSALVGALASACGGGGGDPTGPNGPAASGVTYANGLVSIPLASVPTLAQSGGFLITNGNGNSVRSASGATPDVIVINVGTDQWRAFTSTCTHEGCTVASFNGSRIHCACHDSYYDTAGRNVAGPAPSPLREYALQYDATTRTIVINRG